MIPLNRNLQLVVQGFIVAVVVFFAIIFSGLSTTSLQTSEGYRTFTTLGLGGTEFMILMVSASFIAVTAIGYLLESLAVKKP